MRVSDKENKREKAKKQREVQALSIPPTNNAALPEQNKKKRAHDDADNLNVIDVSSKKKSCSTNIQWSKNNDNNRNEVLEENELGEEENEEGEEEK